MNFEQYVKCCVSGCIHEAQMHGELCRWHYMTNQSKKKHGKAIVQQELDMIYDIDKAVQQIPVKQLVKKLSSR